MKEAEADRIEQPHFYRNVFRVVTRGKVKEVAAKAPLAERHTGRINLSQFKADLTNLAAKCH